MDSEPKTHAEQHVAHSTPTRKSKARLIEKKSCLALHHDLLTRGSIERVRVSARASSIVKPNDSPYYIGLARVLEDQYGETNKPNGIIQLG
ncbi:probable aminotransferase ACS12 [Olea europaea subsp. europaea]|uniref:Probable aminotransferase ACS12 n=1 Tax=Olea europaea subsp. europaea TaxID=158383 RepID=A0A8S0Q6U0_OLEEU|nr:probable aminotransferase ACS12 [Olea europaea subsp. europaea]